MPVNPSKRTTVIMAGTGGRGVLAAARTLAAAAASRYPYVSWLPSYAVSQRGGSCECTVSFSPDYIACPLVLRSESVVVFDVSQLKAFEDRVRTGGTLIIESTDTNFTLERKDITVYRVPALKLANDTGDASSLNFVLLGAYLRSCGMPVADVQAEIRKKYSAKEPVAASNLRALDAGWQFLCKATGGA